MKCIVLISGVLRTFHDTLYPYLCELNKFIDVHLYIHTTPDIYDSNYQGRNYLEQIKDCLQNPICKKCIIDNINHQYPTFDIRENNTLQQWQKLQNLLKSLDLSTINSDDIFLRIRPDVEIHIPPEMFLKILKNEFSSNDLCIPEGNDIFNKLYESCTSNTINDQIAFGKYEIMKIYCSLFSTLEISSLSRPIISEALLYKHLQNHTINIKRVQLPYSLRLSQCQLIAVTGDSGVGKTTLMTSLKKIFPFDKNMVLEADRYHKWERHDDKWKSITHLNPDANYLEKMLDDTFMLKMGEQVLQVDYDHTTGKFTDAQVIEPKQYIFLCGLHTLYTEEMRKISDFKVFIDTEHSLKKLWKIKRDMKKRGYTFEKCLEIFQKRQIDYEKYIFPQKKYADIVVYYYLNEKIPEIFDINYEHSDLQMNLEISDYYLPFIENYLLQFSNRINKNIFKIKNRITCEEIVGLLPEKYRLFIQKQNIDASYLGVIQALIILIFMNPT
jgi:uridine kinase